MSLFCVLQLKFLWSAMVNISAGVAFDFSLIDILQASQNILTNSNSYCRVVSVTLYN